MKRLWSMRALALLALATCNAMAAEKKNVTVKDFIADAQAHIKMLDSKLDEATNHRAVCRDQANDQKKADCSQRVTTVMEGLLGEEAILNAMVEIAHKLTPEAMDVALFILNEALVQKDKEQVQLARDLLREYPGQQPSEK